MRSTRALLPLTLVVLAAACDGSEASAGSTAGSGEASAGSTAGSGGPPPAAWAARGGTGGTGGMVSLGLKESRT
ncbi:hypothetical protein ACMHYB_07180 [Sorangium sp. So ce1128]